MNNKLVCFINIIIITIFVICFVPVFGDDGEFKRFEHKYSFKGPFLAQEDGTIPYWDRRGGKLIKWLKLQNCRKFSSLHFQPFNKPF